MKLSRPALWLLVGASMILALSVAGAVGEDGPDAIHTIPPADSKTVTLEGTDWQVALDRLFGTPDGGLLDGTMSFDFRAEELTLTTLQSADFFLSPASPINLADLVEKTQTLHGTVRLEGTIDGLPFALKIAGHELKLEGLILTSDQLQALVSELQASGLHEMKIRALVDGQMTVAKVERNHEKIEVQGRKHEKDSDSLLADRGKREHPQRIDLEHPVKHERIERPGRIERLEKPERMDSGRR